MNQKRTPINTVAQFVLLAVIVLALVISLITARGAALSGLRTTKGSSLVVASSVSETAPSITPSSTVTPAPTSIPYPMPARPGTESVKTQTAAAIITFKAIGATRAAEEFRTRVPNTPVVVLTGVVEDVRVKYSGKLLGLDAQNGWSGFVNGFDFFIFAGALLSDPEQGAIFMESPFASGSSLEKFLTPTKHGALRAVSRQGDRLTFIAEDGTAFYFDLPTRQFVASLTGIAPSVTPSPTVTPEPTPEPTSVPTPYPMPPGPGTEAP
jgi:hypothetical protein